MTEVKHGHDYEVDAEIEMGTLAEKQRDGWRNLAIALSSVVLVLVGAFIGDFNASLRFRSLSESMTDHARLIGHPVMVEKVGHVEANIQNIEADVSDIKEHQEENGKLLAKIAGKVGVSE